MHSASRELPPFSFRTSFSLLRRMEARSLLKEPLRLRAPEPSCKTRTDAELQGRPPRRGQGAVTAGTDRPAVRVRRLS